MSMIRPRILKKPDKQKEEDLRKSIEEEGGLEKKDLPAMIFSAYVVILPICLLVLVALVVLGFLVFGVFK